MTKDELTALRRERGKQELNIGDKVIVHSASDKPLYDGKVATIIEKGIIGNEVYFGLYIEGVIVEKRSKPLIGAAGIIGTTSLLAPFYAEDLELVKEPTDEIKVGDIVRVKDDAPKDVWRNRIGAVNPSHYKGLPFEVTQIDDDGLERMAHLDSMNGFIHIYIPVRYLEPYYSAEDVRRMEEDLQREKEQHLREHSGKENDDPIKDIADMMEEYRKGFAKITSKLVDFDWQQYRTELVKEIAVKLADKETIMCPSIADYTTNFATRIVDNLKKQSE